RFGHGQGLLLTEPPSINPRDHTTLAPGMVLSTEPGFRLDGVPMLWEDTHVVTETGHAQLTLESPELREIPFCAGGQRTKPAGPSRSDVERVGVASTNPRWNREGRARASGG